MSRRTRGFPPTRPLARRIARPISLGHYQRDLVLRRLRIGAARERRGAMLAGVARSGFADAAGRLQQPKRV